MAAATRTADRFENAPLDDERDHAHHRAEDDPFEPSGQPTTESHGVTPLRRSGTLTGPRLSGFRRSVDMSGSGVVAHSGMQARTPRRRCCVPSARGMLKLRPYPDQIAKASSSNVTAGATSGHAGNLAARTRSPQTHACLTHCCHRARTCLRMLDARCWPDALGVARANAARCEACLLSAPSKASGSGGIAS